MAVSFSGALENVLSWLPGAGRLPNVAPQAGETRIEGLEHRSQSPKLSLLFPLEASVRLVCVCVGGGSQLLRAHFLSVKQGDNGTSKVAGLS